MKKSTSVVFNQQDFRTDYPQFFDELAYPERRLVTTFRIATSLLDNSPSSPIPYNPDENVFIRETALYTLMCHLLTIADWAKNGQSGAVASASEGSVSISFSIPQKTGKSSDYYKQTQCGQAFLQITAPYRIGMHSVGITQYHPWG